MKRLFKKGIVLGAGLVFALTAVVAQAENIVRLATTTSTYNSGLLDAILPVFEKEQGYTVQVIAVGTGKALKMGETGDVDLVLTHAPAAEQRFVDAGFGIEPAGLMYNDFVVVGPEQDGAAVKGMSDVVAAMQQIANGNQVFISRGDDSGTHKKERNLWKAAGVEPTFGEYREVGQGMGKVLQIADELNGYTLTDRGTWLAYESKLRLKLLVEGDERLFNPYQVILVNPARHQGLNETGARALHQWLRSADGQARINNFRVNGKVLFTASAKSE